MSKRVIRKLFLKLILIFLVIPIGFAQENGNDLPQIIGSWWDKNGNKYTFSQLEEAAVLPANLEKVKKEIEGEKKSKPTVKNGIEVSTQEQENGTLEIVTRYPGDKQIVQTRPALAKTEKIETIDNQIKVLEKEIAGLSQSKRFVWIDKRTKEKTYQTKFEKLPKEYQYDGEQFADPNGRQLLAEKEKRIEELKKLKHYFLIDTTDPINFSQIQHDKKAVKLTINVENAQYSYQYPEVFYLNDTIVARRVLIDPQDMTEVPINLMGQLLSEWSPPEWLVLHAIKNGDAVTQLKGEIWRLHVTYKEGNSAIVGLHSPFAQEIVLTKTAPAKISHS